MWVLWYFNTVAFLRCAMSKSRKRPTKAEKVIIRDVEVHIKAKIAKKGGMEDLLNVMFGAGSWAFDPRQNVYVVPDKKHLGADKAFWIVRPDGSWFRAVVPAGMIS